VSNAHVSNSVPDFPTIELEAQGSLLAIRRVQNYRSRPVSHHRGVVTEFTRASRRRLLKQIARIDAEQAVFITLTYPERFPGGAEAKRHLRALLERLRRAYPDSSGIWRLEYQKRGAPHFHLLMYNLPYIPHDELQRWWATIIGSFVTDQLPRVRIELVKSKRGAMYYASKYVAKADDAGSGSSFFIPVTYLHAGRFWGVFNRAKLPLAWQFFIRIALNSPRNFHNAKQIMRRVYPQLNKTRRRGGFCFCDNPHGFIFGLLEALTTE